MREGEEGRKEGRKEERKEGRKLALGKTPLLAFSGFQRLLHFLVLICFLLLQSQQCSISDNSSIAASFS
jgi:hypothetical protein